MMKELLRVGLVGCVSEKRASKCSAKDLYTSDLFVKASRYAERNYDEWLILSAKYGRVHPEDVIEPYDETLNEKRIQERREWSGRVFESIRALFPYPERQAFIFHAGKRYRELLIPLLQESGYRYSIPLEGLKIGEQLKWYREHDE